MHWSFFLSFRRCRCEYIWFWFIGRKFVGLRRPCNRCCRRQRRCKKRWRGHFFVFSFCIKLGRIIVSGFWNVSRTLRCDNIYRRHRKITKNLSLLCRLLRLKNECLTLPKIIFHWFTVKRWLRKRYQIRRRLELKFARCFPLFSKSFRQLKIASFEKMRNYYSYDYYLQFYAQVLYQRMQQAKKLEEIDPVSNLFNSSSKLMLKSVPVYWFWMFSVEAIISLLLQAEMCLGRVLWSSVFFFLETAH